VWRGAQCALAALSTGRLVFKQSHAQVRRLFTTGQVSCRQAAIAARPLGRRRPGPARSADRCSSRSSPARVYSTPNRGPPRWRSGPASSTVSPSPGGRAGVSTASSSPAGRRACSGHARPFEGQLPRRRRQRPPPPVGDILVPGTALHLPSPPASISSAGQRTRSRRTRLPCQPATIGIPHASAYRTTRSVTSRNLRHKLLDQLNEQRREQRMPKVRLRHCRRPLRYHYRPSGGAGGRPGSHASQGTKRVLLGPASAREARRTSGPDCSGRIPAPLPPRHDDRDVDLQQNPPVPGRSDLIASATAKDSSPAASSGTTSSSSAASPTLRPPFRRNQSRQLRRQRRPRPGDRRARPGAAMPAAMSPAHVLCAPPVPAHQARREREAACVLRVERAHQFLVSDLHAVSGACRPLFANAPSTSLTLPKHGVTRTISFSP